MTRASTGTRRSRTVTVRGRATSIMGSLYLCASGLLPLGLPADDVFWSAPAADWTSRKAWKGVNMPADKALKQ